MYKSFFFFLFCFVAGIFSVCLPSCYKEYSYEGGFSNGSAGGTAVYTLEGAGGACDGAAISGQYYQNIPLSNSNTIQLKVQVDSVGTYAITTNTADGFSFVTSGNFTTTGIQTITLTGQGIPASAGDFTFIPPVGLGCNFIVSVSGAAIVPTGFTFEGAPDNCTNPKVDGDYISGKALQVSNIVIVNVNVTTIGPYTITTDTLDGINFSAKGSFTKTGTQAVTLNGSGTPSLARYLLFTLYSPGIPGCSFNVSVINPEPLAIYVLESGFGTSSSPCIYTVQGTYTHNTILDNTNTVTMRVYVSAVGNFTICTNTIDGITFSYSGTFTTLGSQYVILVGDGTPVNTGTFTFTPNIVGPHPLGGEACSFDITVL